MDRETPEYQSKLDAKRQEKIAKRKAAYEAAEKARLERKAQREAEIKAEKAISQFVGNVGDKIDLVLEYVSCGNWQMHYGWQTQTMYAHTFKDENGNVFVWKTTNYIGNVEIGDKVRVKGTIKDHEEYKEQKQTHLTRCKVCA